MKIAVLMTCHNRKESTLRCLRGLPSDLDVFLVDDASTDGTGDAVREFSRAERDGRVEVLEGNGSLYWARGMALAWRASLKVDGRVGYDGWLWLNDDVALSPEAIATRLCASYAAHPDAILVGACVNSKGEETYGLRDDLFTGNFVFVPRAVYTKLGMICGEYAHAWADSDYAMRAKRAGITVVSCGVVGRCEGHANRPSLKGLSLRQRWAMLHDPKGWNLHDLFLYRRRNWGVCAAVASCIHMVFHVLKGVR